MTINRNLTIQQLLNQLPFENKYLNEKVVKSLTNEGPTDGEIEFFKIEEVLSSHEVLAEYQKRKLVPDLGALLTYLIAHPEVLNDKQNIAIQLPDNNFAHFDRGVGDGRCVRVDRCSSDWDVGRWFGGRKVSQPSDARSLDPVLEFLDTLELGIKNLREKL